MEPQALSLQGLQLPLTAPVQAAELDALARILALVGQDLDLRLLATGPQGSLLETLSGQRIPAEGELPFPPETLLKVRVQQDPQGAPRLRVMEAQVPREPEILAPLAQGEAQALAQRLSALELPPALEPLARLFAALQAPVPEAPAAAPLRTVLASLPEPLLRSLGVALGLPAAAPPAERLQVLESWVRALPGGLPETPTELEPKLQTLLARPALRGMEAEALQTSLAVWAHPNPDPPTLSQIPAPDRNLLRSLLGLPEPPTAADPDPLAAFLEGRDPGIPAAARPASQTEPGFRPAMDRPLEPSLVAALPEPALRILARALGFTVPEPPAGHAAAMPAATAFRLPAGSLAELLRPALQQLFQALDLPMPEDADQARELLARTLPDLLGRAKDAPSRIIQGFLSRNPDLPASLRTTLQVAGQLVERAKAGLTQSPGSEALKGTVASPEPLPAARPETWESWIRSGMEVLGDPALSPGEAPFHLAQAREGTALFELPLPWAPQNPLQIWVEGDAEGEGAAFAEAEKRVLLSFEFSRTGQTRVGLGQSSRLLRVRIWAEDPGPIQARQAELETELEALGKPVDLKILPMGSGAPDLRALARGRGLELLG